MNVAADDVSRLGQIAEVVTLVDGVAGLHAGPLGEVGTYLPGDRLAGVRARDEMVEVHIAIVFGHRIDEVGQAVQRVVEPLVRKPVHVVVEDVVAR